ncbi:hypothetical protein Tco_0577204, partial [Tanacetum coccineum]
MSGLEAVKYMNLLQSSSLNVFEGQFHPLLPLQPN